MKEPRQKFQFMKQLTLLFIALKLTHYIDWSWLWVLAPLWGGIVTSVLLDRLTGGLEALIERLEAKGNR